MLIAEVGSVSYLAFIAVADKPKFLISAVPPGLPTKRF